jgi:hypothetical protein
MLRAIAVATDTSDLVGTVDLACEDAGLAVTFVRASAYAAAYVPTMPAQGRRAVVPYAAITEVWDDGETLRLQLEAPRIPYRRLVLAHFTRDHRVDHSKLHRERLKWQVGVAGGASLVVALLLRVAGELSPSASSIAGALVTFGAVAAALWGTQAAGRRVMLGGVDSAAERRAFFFDLKRRVGPTRVIDESGLLGGPSGRPGFAGRPGEAGWPGAPGGAVPFGNTGGAAGPGGGRFSEIAPTLMAVGAAAAVALVSVFAGTRLLSPDAPLADDPRLLARGPGPDASQAGAISAALAPSAPPPVAEPLESCLCQIPASPAVPVRVPKVTFLPRVERMGRDPKRPSLAIEVAAINNSATALRDVEGQVLFMTAGQRPGDPPRVRAERGIYYEGPLLEGAAIKWRVAGRGTMYRVTGPAEQFLDDAALAPADAFAKLLSARTRSVRVHGAAMLARMRDERATAAIEKLREDARDEEQPQLAALARAAAPIYTCDVELALGEAGQAAVTACVMNTGDEESGPLDAVLMLSSVPPKPGQPPPAGQAGQEAQVDPGELGRGPIALVSAALRRSVVVPPRQGVRISGSADVTPATGRQVSTEVVLEPSR